MVGGTYIELPKEEYLHIKKGAHTVVVCTMRQKVLHMIGLNSGHIKGRLYTRHGKKYYRPYRNYFCGNDPDLDKLVEAGYMDYGLTKVVFGGEQRIYWFNREGLDWLGDQLGIIIKDEDD